MSLPGSPATEIQPASTPSASGELTTMNISLNGFLMAAVCLFAPRLRRRFGSFFLSSAAIPSTSPNSNPGADGEDEPLPTVLAAALLIPGTEHHRLPGQPIPAPPVAIQTRHRRRGAILDEDDPADEGYDPSNDNDREPLAADKPYENGPHRLSRADQEIVNQYHEQVLGRNMVLRPVGYPEGVIARNRPFRP